MSEAKFTKGPWKVDFGETFRVRDQSGASVSWVTFVHLNGRREEPEVTANAHLIAASPEIYEALRMATNDLNTAASLLPDVAPALLETVKQAHAALAKARGEA